MLRSRLSDLVALPRRYALILVVVLLVGAFALVYAAGGTRTALPHVFYLPVVLAAVYVGRRGGIVAGAAATLLCGPMMPLDVASGLAQTPGNWLARGAFFMAIGATTGVAVRAVTVGFEESLTQHLHEELVRPPEPVGDDAQAVARVRRVLDERLLQMVFQPIYSLRDGQLMAVEALARFPATEPAWSTDVWFSQAEQAGLGVALELEAARAALRAAKQLPDTVAVSINASPSLLNDPRMHEMLDRTQGRLVIVEITEHVIVDDYVVLDRALASLRHRGVRIAVDDAGAGFASLRHILRLTPDIIKLDISLTQNVRDDHVRRAMAAALVQFARETETMLVAEGVETQSDLATWQDIGAHGAQGYLLGRPGPVTATLEPPPCLAHLSSGGLVDAEAEVRLGREGSTPQAPQRAR